MSSSSIFKTEYAGYNLVFSFTHNTKNYFLIRLIILIKNIQTKLNELRAKRNWKEINK